MIARAGLRFLWAVMLAALAVDARTAALGQSAPQNLPAPEIPVAPLPPPAAGGVPYLGPPQSIDGPPQATGSGPLFPTPEGFLGPGEPPLAGPDGYLPLGEGDLEAWIDDGLAPAPPKLPANKSGFFQQLSLTAAWFGNSNDPNDLGGTEIETYLRVAVPAPIREWPLVITPGYNMTFIDGPTVTDLPPRLYLAYVDLMWLPTVVHRWTALVAVAPSVFGDFEAGEFRLTGKGLVIFDWVPERLQLVAGVLYLNRENIRLLPAGGLIWTPADWARFELLFPKPKLGLRYHTGTGYEDWLFATAEFGGNTWPIVRASGLEDNVTYLDYRLILGIERKLAGGAGYRLEGGYVFGRSIEFTSGNGDFDPQNTFILRGAILF
jgi:hypothetical protein